MGYLVGMHQEQGRERILNPENFKKKRDGRKTENKRKNKPRANKPAALDAHN
jgi:hypothetical protein